jgi:DNA-binding LacI/PurR family transcriptional regulator
MVLHSLAHAGPPEDLPLFFRRFHFDGVLMLGALPGMTDRVIERLAGRDLPFVLVGRTVKEPSVTSVTADNSHGGRLAAAHLCELGHTRIAVMRGPRGWPDITQRIEGFRNEVRRRGVDADSLRLFPCASRQANAGCKATARLLESWKPTALFCMNDATAVGSMSALRGSGWRIPGDVSVVGFDDSELAEYSVPPLTSIRQPRMQMGREGARRLMQAMQGRQPESLVLDVALIVRGSTCPPS